MVERGRETRLPQYPLTEFWVVRQTGEQHLERHEAVEIDVARPVHLAHTAAADERFDPEARDLFASR